jgi:hypothetical protein
MHGLGIIDILNTYCTSNNIYFICDQKGYQNALADNNVYANNKRIMLAWLKPTATDINGYRINKYSVSGQIALGQKREAVTTGVAPNQTTIETESNIDETFMQKYDRRLKNLMIDISNVIQKLACDNEMDIISLNFDYDINALDLNADFIIANITLEYDN